MIINKATKTVVNAALAIGRLPVSRAIFRSKGLAITAKVMASTTAGKYGRMTKKVRTTTPTSRMTKKVVCKREEIEGATGISITVILEGAKRPIGSTWILSLRSRMTYYLLYH